MKHVGYCRSVFSQMLCQFSQILEQTVIQPLLPENAVGYCYQHRKVPLNCFHIFGEGEAFSVYRPPPGDRAIQFAQLTALTGYEAAVGKLARLTVKRREFDAQEAEELDRRLAATAILKRVISIAGEMENAFL